MALVAAEDSTGKPSATEIGNYPHSSYSFSRTKNGAQMACFTLCHCEMFPQIMYAFNVGYRQEVERVKHVPLPNRNFQKKSNFKKTRK
jgi:hypothetical protein